MKIDEGEAPGKLALKPLVTAEYAEVVNQARRVVEQVPKDFHWLFHCRLSSALPRNRSTARENIEGFEYSAKTDIAILGKTDQYPGALVPLVFIDLATEGEKSRVEANMRLLQELRKTVPRPVHIALHRTSSSKSFERLNHNGGDNAGWLTDLRKALESWDGRAQRNEVINPARWENDVALQLTRALDEEGLVYLAQVKLSDVILWPERCVDFSQRQKAFFDRTDFDGVIATKPPFSIPLMAIEIDGSIHRTKPDKKKKDNWKNSIAKKANLPLVRIAHGGSIVKQETERAIQACCAMATSLSPHDPEKLSIYLDMLSDELRSLDWAKARNIEINVEHIRKVYDSLISLYHESNKSLRSAYVDQQNYIERDFEYENERYAWCQSQQYRLDSGRYLWEMRVALESKNLDELVKQFGFYVSASLGDSGCYVQGQLHANLLTKRFLQLHDFSKTMDLPALKVIASDDMLRKLEPAVSKAFSGSLRNDLLSDLEERAVRNRGALLRNIELSERELDADEIREIIHSCSGAEDRLIQKLDKWIGVPKEYRFQTGIGEEEARRRLCEMKRKRLQLITLEVRRSDKVAEEWKELVIQEITERYKKQLAEVELIECPTEWDAIDPTKW